MSDEEEELREFCDGFDEGTTDRIVPPVPSGAQGRYEFDRYATDDAHQAGVRACWKNLLFKARRRARVPDDAHAPATPVPPPPPTKTMTPRAKRAQAKSNGLGFLGVLV